MIVLQAINSKDVSHRSDCYFVVTSIFSRNKQEKKNIFRKQNLVNI